jgi:hypothetical protein
MLFLGPPSTFLPGGQQSRTHYQVLAVSRDEQDPQVIEGAALACTSHVRAYQLTREAEATLQLNEIAQALITLLDPVQRRQYDHDLDELPGREVSEFPRPQPRRAPAPEEAVPVLLTSDEGACDVKLVCRKKTTCPS